MSNRNPFKRGDKVVCIETFNSEPGFPQTSAGTVYTVEKDDPNWVFVKRDDGGVFKQFRNDPIGGYNPNSFKRYEVPANPFKKNDVVRCIDRTRDGSDGITFGNVYHIAQDDSTYVIVKRDDGLNAYKEINRSVPAGCGGYGPQAFELVKPKKVGKPWRPGRIDQNALPKVDDTDIIGTTGRIIITGDIVFRKAKTKGQTRRHVMLKRCTKGGVYRYPANFGFRNMGDGTYRMNPQCQTCRNGGNCAELQEKKAS